MDLEWSKTPPQHPGFYFRMLLEIRRGEYFPKQVRVVHIHYGRKFPERLVMAGEGAEVWLNNWLKTQGMMNTCLYLWAGPFLAPYGWEEALKDAD